MRLYLDNCCYNRPFDDQKQLRVRLEAEAKLEIQGMILSKSAELAWSYVLEFENALNPFEQRRVAIRQWRGHATVDTNETEQILSRAEKLVQVGLKSKDALHLACAIVLGCDFFITTDDHLIKKAIGVTGIKVIDPITFIREECQ